MITHLLWYIMGTIVSHNLSWLTAIAERLSKFLGLIQLLLQVERSITSCALLWLPLSMILLRYIVLILLINRSLIKMGGVIILLVRIRKHLCLKNVFQIHLHNLLHLLIMKVNILPKMIWVVIKDI